MSVLFPQTYQYKPFINAGWVKGRYQSYYSDTLSEFSGNIQPVGQEEFDSLDIGRELKGMIKIYTDKILNRSIEGTKENGDLIQYDGKEWEVIDLNLHTGTLLPHRRYFAELRINNDDLG